MSTDSYVDCRRLWHPLPDGHAVEKPRDAVMMRDFFRNPSMYQTSRGKIKGHSWTPFCRADGVPPVFISEFADAPDGLTVPYESKDDPESFVPNEKHPGYFVMMRFEGRERAIMRNFVKMLKQYLLDEFPTMAPEKLLKKFPTPEAQAAYIEEHWTGWAGTYETEDGELRDAYGKMKTVQFLRNQETRRYKREATEFIAVRSETLPDGTVTQSILPSQVDHTCVTRGSRVKAMFYIDWVAFSDGEKRDKQGDIYLSFTAKAVVVEPFVEAASIRNPKTLAMLGLSQPAAPIASPPAAPPAASPASPPAAPPAAPTAALPVPPSVEAKKPSKTGKRAASAPSSPSKRVRAP